MNDRDPPSDLIDGDLRTRFEAVQIAEQLPSDLGLLGRWRVDRVEDDHRDVAGNSGRVPRPVREDATRRRFAFGLLFFAGAVEPEERDIARLSVLGNDNIGFGQIGDRFPVAVVSDHAELHEGGAGAEDR
jgi:hypothetical protein